MMITFTCIFVTLTLILTGLATMFLTMSLLSDEWEFISYKLDKIEEIAQSKNHTFEFLAGQMSRIEMIEFVEIVRGNITKREYPKSVIYLVPAHGGVNKLCADIVDEVRETMKSDGYYIETCISYLESEKIISKDAWLDRMRNLAMSCAMVCLILLGCSAPLGILGLLKKQISTIMVTGVMYILAGVFGIFNLAFMHFKRVKPEGYYTSTILDKNLPEEYMKSRVFTVGWPPSLEWAGLCLCLIASLFWLLLAKIYRFQILSPT